MTEVWRPVPSNPLYEVSDLGRVRSLDGFRTEGRRYVFRRGRILKASIGSHGYPFVKTGRENVRTVHSLVAEAFLGPTPPGLEIRHDDGNRTNPALANLLFGTRLDNIEDAFRHGTRQRSRRNSSCAM